MINFIVKVEYRGVRRKYIQDAWCRHTEDWPLVFMAYVLADVYARLRDICEPFWEDEGRVYQLWRWREALEVKRSSGKWIRETGGEGIVTTEQLWMHWPWRGVDLPVIWSARRNLSYSMPLTCDIHLWPQLFVGPECVPIAVAWEHILFSGTGHTPI